VKGIGNRTYPDIFSLRDVQFISYYGIEVMLLATYEQVKLPCTKKTS